MKASTTAITAEDATGLRQPAINLTISLDNPHHLNSTLYNIYRATSKNGTYKLIGTREAYYDTLSYHDTDVSPNKTYWYQVAPVLTNDDYIKTATTGKKSKKISHRLQLEKPDFRLTYHSDVITVHLSNPGFATGF